MMKETDPSSFHTHLASMLILKAGTAAIDFYDQAFGAIALQGWSNEDRTMFHRREPSQETGRFCPSSIGGVTSIVELFVEDPHLIATRAISEGPHLLSPVIDHEKTGYCEGTLGDPIGQRWTLIRKIKRGKPDDEIELFYRWAIP